MPALTLQNVTKIFPGSVTAVDEVSLEAADGERLVLVGPSGCGKTTLLRLIAGVETPTRGTIAMEGRVVNRLRPRDRDVAMVFQGQALYPHMDVRRNLAFGLALRKTPRAEIGRRVREAAALLGLETLLDRRPEALSGGQRQRVALGRAIVRRPKLFLLDEPLAHLDARRRDRMRGEIRRLFDRLETTVIHVTHDPAEAMALGRRIAVLGAGRLEQVGEPMALYRRPANRFVAEMLGAHPMNFFEGRLVGREGALVFEHPDFSIPIPPAAALPENATSETSLLLGIRPEDLFARTPDAGASLPSLAGRVVFLEPLGAETHVTLETGATRWSWLSREPRPCRLGDRLELSVAPELLYYFGSSGN